MSVRSTQGELSLGKVGNDVGFHGEFVMSSTSQGVVRGGEPFENSSDPDSKGDIDEEYEDEVEASQERGHKHRNFCIDPNSEFPY